MQLTLDHLEPAPAGTPSGCHHQGRPSAVGDFCLAPLGEGGRKARGKEENSLPGGLERAQQPGDEGRDEEKTLNTRAIFTLPFYPLPVPPPKILLESGNTAFKGKKES